jgi:glycosyltransferase involved in cell wall biosynthesis
MKSPSLITIVICTRNRASVLERVLAHHHRYILPNGWEREYVIVNNGSTDRTNEVIEDFGRKATFPVRLIVESRPGHSIALNSGCRAATGEIIAFTDDDAIPADQWLAEIIRSISDLGNDWVYGPVRPLWEFGKNPLWYGPKTAFWVACPDYGNQPFLATDPSTTFVGVNHACKTTRLFELGLYDEQKGLRGDGKSYTGNDDDLYMKSLAMGFRVFYNPLVSVNHIIDKKRYDGLTHLKNSWIVGRNECLNYRLLSTSSQTGSKSLIPRYRYRLLVSHLAGAIVSCVLLSPSSVMFYLANINRFIGFLYTSILLNFRKSPSAT